MLLSVFKDVLLLSGSRHLSISIKMYGGTRLHLVTNIVVDPTVVNRLVGQPLASFSETHDGIDRFQTDQAQRDVDQLALLRRAPSFFLHAIDIGA